jgi:L-ascorbate metabolism protein UlaG (beta-lactamase superfamily)
MQVEWYGQSAFRLTDGATTVFIDPFDDLTRLSERGLRWEYPAIADVRADLLLVTHEHLDHNGVEAIAGDPVVLRSTAGRLESPVGEVLAVASEHDAAAGTERGPNTLCAFTLGGRRVAHLGDFGQGALRDEQATSSSPSTRSRRARRGCTATRRRPSRSRRSTPTTARSSSCPPRPDGDLYAWVEGR